MEFRNIIYIILLIIITFIFYQAEEKNHRTEDDIWKKNFLCEQALLSQVLFCQ